MNRTLIAGLTAALKAHIGRMRRLMAMHGSMMQRMKRPT